MMSLEESSCEPDVHGWMVGSQLLINNAAIGQINIYGTIIKMVYCTFSHFLHVFDYTEMVGYICGKNIALDLIQYLLVDGMGSVFKNIAPWRVENTDSLGKMVPL